MDRYNKQNMLLSPLQGVPAQTASSPLGENARVSIWPPTWSSGVAIGTKPPWALFHVYSQTYIGI